MKNKRRLILIILLLLLLLLIGVNVYNKEILNIDKLAYNIIVKKLRNPSLTKIMKIITKLGNPKTVIILCLITSSIIYIKNKLLALIIPINISIVTLINQFIKLLIKRPRPSGYRLINIGGYSFPSGHSMISIAFYGLFIYLVGIKVKNKLLKTILILLLTIIIVLIGISRIYLGVHYLSDVIAGYITSIIYLLIVINPIKKYILKEKP